MDAATAAGPVPGVEAPDADVPVRALLRTTDVDEARLFCRRLFYSPLHVDPVGDPADFAFHGDVIQLGPLTVGEISYGTDIRLDIGDLQSGYHVLAPLTGTVLARHRGIQTCADHDLAAVFRPVGEVELHWPAGCTLLSIKVDRSTLEREWDDLPGPPGLPLPLGASFATSSGPGRTWAELVRLLHEELSGCDGMAAQPVMARRWRKLIVSGLALSVDFGADDDPRSTMVSRPRPVKRAIDLMHADPAYPFTVAELAATAGVGVRVLQESFRRHVGMSPLTYLRRLRLDLVHADLTEGDPRQVSVSEVAYRRGFTHLGRFAGAYRARYGLTPSQTLRRRA